MAVDTTSRWVLNSVTGKDLFGPTINNGEQLHTYGWEGFLLLRGSKSAIVNAQIVGIATGK